MTASDAKPSGSRFQNFSEVGGPARCAERVQALRAELARQGLAGFIVPRADQHQNEYVPAASERLLWLTGFSGSAGLAIVLKDRAALFVDGRYTVQAASQVDTAVVEPLPLVETPPAAWLESVLESGDRIGYDPWLHTPETIDRLSRACAKAGAALAPVEANPVDGIWTDRPAEPVAPIGIHPAKYAGDSAEKKLARVQERLARVDGLVVSDPHNVAWMLNIRGHDVAHTPLPLSYAFAPRSGRPTIFVDGRKLSNSVRTRLSQVCEIEEPGRLVAFAEALGRERKRILFDAATCPYALSLAFAKSGGEPVVEADPISRLKACKNAVELAGAAAAHLRDGAAMAAFLAWFDAEAPKGGVTEISAATQLEACRAASGALKDISFPTISAAGPHAAIPHYRVSEASNLRVEPGLFLIDSGGQYQDGTTDITRTISVGRTTPEMRDRFTRVLKGHIAIAGIVFPKGTTGAQIDTLARMALWRAGLDFDHGTGHGVGSYLSVHEGPQRIAKTGSAPLEPGMIVSNEPGYYAAGRFGIRTENLIVVEPRAIAGAEREMYGFRTISLAPIDTRAIDVRGLDATELDWLNRYHAEVRAKISPLVDAATLRWLSKATRKI